MTNRKRISALLLCAALLIMLSVSIAFIAHEADHDCCGEDCPVCRMIAVNIRLLRTLGLIVLILQAFYALLSGLQARRGEKSLGLFRAGTPVSWKIRLND